MPWSSAGDRLGVCRRYSTVVAVSATAVCVFGEREGEGRWGALAAGDDAAVAATAAVC